MDEVKHRALVRAPAAARVSLIVATCRRPEALRETLRSLASVNVPMGYTVEALIVENVIQDGAEGMVKEFFTNARIEGRYLFEPLRGKSHALNLALKRASGEILLFTDDDVRFPEDWIERMCEPILTRVADAVAGGVRLAQELIRPWMNHTHRAWLASTADYLPAADPSEMCGANMAVTRRVFDRVGTFDPALGPGVTSGGEESLLSWQIKRAGFRLLGLPEVQVEHHPSADRLKYGSWIKTARLQGQTRAYLMHHWFHRTVRFPRALYVYYSVKLFLRRLISPRPAPEDEGIAPWELSYREEISKYAHYIHESRAPIKYPKA